MGNETHIRRKLEIGITFADIVKDLDLMRGDPKPDSKGAIRLHAERSAVELVRLTVDQGFALPETTRSQAGDELRAAFTGIWERDRALALSVYDVLTDLPPGVFPDPRHRQRFINTVLGVVIKNGEITPLALPRPTIGAPIGARREA